MSATSGHEDQAVELADGAIQPCDGYTNLWTQLVGYEDRHSGFRSVSLIVLPVDFTVVDVNPDAEDLADAPVLNLAQMREYRARLDELIGLAEAFEAAAPGDDDEGEAR